MYIYGSIVGAVVAYTMGAQHILWKREQAQSVSSVFPGIFSKHDKILTLQFRFTDDAHLTWATM